jgi:hypothetical protein
MMDKSKIVILFMITHHYHKHLNSAYADSFKVTMFTHSPFAISYIKMQ